MTHDEISRFFSEEDVKKAFQLPDWPAGTEVVCYCRSTDSRDTIEQIAQQRQWKIAKYVHIDELPIAKLYKPGQVVLAKCGRENWALQVASGTCAWCGYDGHELLNKQKNDRATA